VSAISTTVCAIAALSNYILSLKLQTEVAKLRLEMAERSAKDREDLMAFMNGSFMRAAVVEAKLEALKACHA
jgi:hypothetical protein